MRYNLLLNEIYKIQIEYKELLIKLLPILNTEDILPALDEINIFWESNIEVIELYLQNYARTQNTYVFTASTYLDIESQDHLPFLLLGDSHIFDDSLSIMQEFPVTKGMIEQVKLIAEDNIKIISICQKNILVLPLRMLNQLSENTVLISAAEQYFCSLFDGIPTIRDYFKQCNSFQDINNYLKETSQKYILFSNQDDCSLSFEQRFFDAKNNEAIKLVTTNNDAEIFFSLVFGPIQQAIDILMSCLEYRCIPFIRYKVAFHYFVMLSQTLKTLDGFEQIDIIEFKVCIAHLIYNIFEVEKNNIIAVDEFVSIIKADGFESNLFHKLDICKQNNDRYSLNVIANIIKDSLNCLYEKLK